MIRRSCNSRFRKPILDDVKITTIRDKAWPIGVPIMLFEWSGKPYRSKQVEIAPVIVEFTERVWIYHFKDGSVNYSHGLLWKTEGFNSRAEMDDWFRPLVKPGQTVTKALMRFRRIVEGGMP